jgi:transcriptional regulator with XRE-family HTH domain
VLNQGFRKDRLKQTRLAKKLTMESLAKLVNTTKGTISNYENGHSTPPNEMLSHLADVLETSTDYLLGRTNDSTPPLDGDEPPLSPDEEKEWSLIQKELTQDDALFFHQFLKAPNKKKRQLIKYWEHILMDDDED